MGAVQIDLTKIIFEGLEFQDHSHIEKVYASFLQNSKTCQLKDYGSELERISEMQECFKWPPIPSYFHKRFNKNAETSTNLRCLGTNQPDVSDSLRAYNLAVTFAPINSLELAFALEKRADVLIRLGERELAQVDIDSVAKIVCYPVKRFQNLVSLQERCGLLDYKSVDKERMKFCGTFYKISDENERVPGLTKGVEIDYSERCGRRVICDRDFEVGSVLMIDEPFSFSLEKTLNWDHMHCTHCSRPILSGLPCDCCSFGFYCTPKCKSNDYKIHKYETYFSYLKATKVLPLKGLLSARILFKAGIQELYRIYSTKDPLYFETLDEEGNPKKGFESGRYSRNYLSIYHLINHGDLRSPANCFKALVLGSLLEESGFFGMHGSDLNFKLFVISLLLRHMESIEFNAITLSELDAKNKTTTIRYGAAVYPLLCLINHSCDPNCVPVRSTKLLKTSVIAMRKIREGEEITFSYAPHYGSWDVLERRLFLEKKYNFTCTCEACLYNWSPSNLTRSFQESQCNTCGKYLLTGQCPKCTRKDEFAKSNFQIYANQDIAINSLIKAGNYEQALGLTKECLDFFYGNFSSNHYLSLQFQDLFKKVLVGIVNY